MEVAAVRNERAHLAGRGNTLGATEVGHSIGHATGDDRFAVAGLTSHSEEASLGVAVLGSVEPMLEVLDVLPSSGVLGADDGGDVGSATGSVSEGLEFALGSEEVPAEYRADVVLVEALLESADVAPAESWAEEVRAEFSSDPLAVGLDAMEKRLMDRIDCFPLRPPEASTASGM